MHFELSYQVQVEQSPASPLQDLYYTEVHTCASGHMHNRDDSYIDTTAKMWKQLISVVE